jgi:hypothetical protein
MPDRRHIMLYREINLLYYGNVNKHVSWAECRNLVMLCKLYINYV